MESLNKVLILLTIGLLVLLLGMCSRIDSQQTQANYQQSVIQAAQDSVRYYRDRYGREVASKAAMETNLETLRKNQRLLTGNQRALYQDIIHLPRNERKRLLTASSTQQVVSITNHQNVDSAARQTHSWTLHSDTLQYQIRTLGDTLRIDTLRIPNRLLITQSRDEKGNILVTARNTNPMIRTPDVDAVIIPQDKPKKFWKWVFMGAGIILGVVVTR